MATDIRNVEEHLLTVARSFGRGPILVHPSKKPVDLATGYIPLLANFTYEDKAAKGLRKRTADDKPELPVYFSALELVQDHTTLLLTGSAGSGKTTFAKYLCYGLATGTIKEPRIVPRNEFGHVQPEAWTSGAFIPCYFGVHSIVALKKIVDDLIPALILSLTTDKGQSYVNLALVLDITVEDGFAASPLLMSLINRYKESPSIKILLLSTTKASQDCNLTSGVARYELLPLLEVQRRQSQADIDRARQAQEEVALGLVASRPAFFALAFEAKYRGDHIEDLLDAWLSNLDTEHISIGRIIAEAFSQFQQQSTSEATTTEVSMATSMLPLLARSRAVLQILAARHLAKCTPQEIVDLYHHDRNTWDPVIRYLLPHLGQSPKRDEIIERLIHDTSPSAQYGALLVADSVTLESPNLVNRVKAMLLQIVAEGSLSTMERRTAGRILSELGDPRDLEELTLVTAGTFILGSDSHPNSQPTSVVSTEAFRIGCFPVVNQHYSRFIEETGRLWRSADGKSADKQNVPATDLTWHDARAYCAWVTHFWQQQGRIHEEEHVRLPTEVEWERASRGDLKEAAVGQPVWPWGPTWINSSANFEEAGVNEPCAVGLFPSGRSPSGCYDMAGQVWEWCSTLWGEDMSTPTLQYPYQADDGREDAAAPDTVRRVLRGGCFSSGRLKVSSSYRGSLEPTGFWRGNGFRVVVARK